MTVEIDKDTARALKREFGYVPDEPSGEKWVVFADRLIVVHPERKPRIYKQGCCGSFFELDPSLG